MRFLEFVYGRAGMRSLMLLLLAAGLFILRSHISPEGHMTGGGSAFVSGNSVNPPGTRVTHGFTLQCNVTNTPNNLEINWGPGDRFHLEMLTSAVCTDEPPPQCSAAPPSAPFHVYFGAGKGRYNGVPGATATWKFTDCGEPGTQDTAEIYIQDVNGNNVLELVVGTPLTFGNHQAHRDSGNNP